MLDGLKGYVSLVSGLTEATAAKAREVATALLAQGGVQGVPAGASAMATQIAGLAEDLLVTARDNRGVLLEVVREEAERAVASLGVITAAEVQSLRGRIAELERELAVERARPAPAVAGSSTRRSTPSPAATKAPATTTRAAKKSTSTATPTKAPSTRSTATKKAATKTTAKKATAKKATATPSPAKKSAAKKSTATRSTATRSTAKRSTAKKSTAKKSTATRSTANKAAATKRTAGARSPGAGAGE